MKNRKFFKDTKSGDFAYSPHFAADTKSGDFA